MRNPLAPFGEYLGNSIAEKIGNENLLKGLDRADNLRQGIASRQGWGQAGQSSGVDILAALLGSQDIPGISAISDYAVQTGEGGNQINQKFSGSLEDGVLSDTPEFLKGPLRVGMETAVPSGAGEVTLSAIPAIGPSAKGVAKTASGANKGFNATSRVMGTPVDELMAGMKGTPRAKIPKIIPADESAKIMNRGAAGLAGQLKKMGVPKDVIDNMDVESMRKLIKASTAKKVKPVTPAKSAKQNTKAANAEAEAVLKGERVIPVARTGSAAKVKPAPAPTAAAAAADDVAQAAARPGRLSRAGTAMRNNKLATAGAAATGLSVYGALTGNDDQPITPEESDGVVNPFPEPGGQGGQGAQQAGAQQAGAGSSAQQQVLEEILRMMQPKKPGIMETIGDTMQNMGQSLQGRDPRLSQSQVNQPTREQQILQSIIPQLKLFEAMGPARLAQLEAELKLEEQYAPKGFDFSNVNPNAFQ